MATLLHSSPHSGTLPVTCPVTCHKQNSSHELDASKQSPHGTLLPVTCPVTCRKQNSSHQHNTSKLSHVHHQSSNLSQTQQFTSIQHFKTVSAGHVHHQWSNLSQTQQFKTVSTGHVHQQFTSVLKQSLGALHQQQHGHSLGTFQTSSAWAYGHTTTCQTGTRQFVECFNA